MRWIAQQKMKDICVYISAAYREAMMQRTLKVDENTVLAAPRLLLADHDGGQH